MEQVMISPARRRARFALGSLLLSFALLGVASADGHTQPRLPGPDGALTEIWARNTIEGYLNAKRFCKSVNDPPVGGPPFSWGYGCGDEESSYLDFRKGQWVLEEAEAKASISLCERTGYCPTDKFGWPLGKPENVKCDLHGHGHPILAWVYCGN
jgi:hypothetical protein